MDEWQSKLMTAADYLHDLSSRNLYDERVLDEVGVAIMACGEAYRNIRAVRNLDAAASSQ